MITAESQELSASLITKIKPAFSIFKDRFEQVVMPRKIRYDFEPKENCLQDIRKQFFQFNVSGNSQTNRGMSVPLTQMANKCGVKLQLIQTPTYLSPRGWTFEVNLPVHRIFENEFTALFKSIFSGAKIKCAEMVFGVQKLRQTQISTFKSSYLCENYLIIRHAGQVLEKSQVTDNPAEFIKTIAESAFHFFGRYLLAIRRTVDSEIEFFDCTRLPPFPTAFNDVIDGTQSAMKQMIATDSTNLTYHLFVFTAWRQ